MEVFTASICQYAYFVHDQDINSFESVIKEKSLTNLHSQPRKLGFGFLLKTKTHYYFLITGKSRKYGRVPKFKKKTKWI